MKGWDKGKEKEAEKINGSGKREGEGGQDEWWMSGRSGSGSERGECTELGRERGRRRGEGRTL